VAYVEDDTYLSHHPALMPLMFDIQSIEAVRGPQALSMAATPTARALHHDNKPVLNDWQASAAVTVATIANVGTELVLNAPIGRTAAVRAAVATDNHSGYFDDGSQGAITTPRACDSSGSRSMT